MLSTCGTADEGEEHGEEHEAVGHAEDADAEELRQEDEIGRNVTQ